MTFFTRFLFALTGLCFFLSTSVSDAKLVRRAPPDFIANWPLLQYWQDSTEGLGAIDTPSLNGVQQGEFEVTGKKMGNLKWKCSTVALGDIIYEFTSTLQKGELKDSDQTKTVLTKRSNGDKWQVVYGAKLQRSLDHPNILPVIDYLITPADDTPKAKDFGWAIMDYVEGGSLERNYASYGDQNAVNTAFKQVLSAVAAVSSAGIIHRDIKPENFLVDGDTLKLIDFDTALQADSSAQPNVGTESYQAPGM
jgi:serine/threonine protein kinase